MYLQPSNIMRKHSWLTLLEHDMKMAFMKSLDVFGWTPDANSTPALDSQVIHVPKKKTVGQLQCWGTRPRRVTEWYIPWSKPNVPNLHPAFKLSGVEKQHPCCNGSIRRTPKSKSPPFLCGTWCANKDLALHQHPQLPKSHQESHRFGLTTTNRRVKCTWRLCTYTCIQCTHWLVPCIDAYDAHDAHDAHVLNPF